MTKTFGSIAANVELSAEDEENIYVFFKLRRQPEGAMTETGAEFEKNLFDAARWVLKCFHVAQEKGQAERLEELLRQFKEEDTAAGIETD